MRDYRSFVVLALMLLLFASCNKEHYNVGNVHGINAEGEVLLPIGSKTLTMMDMMQRFQIDSLVSCAGDGSLSYDYCYEYLGVLSGDELLRFKDLRYEGHYEMENTFDDDPSGVDTVVRFQHTLVFQADHIGVYEAQMKSGRLSFTLASNVGVVRRVILRSVNITDAAGNDFVNDVVPQSNSFGFGMEGMHYKTDTVNSLTLDFEVYCTYIPTSDDVLFIDYLVEGDGLAFSEMTGYVEPYDTRNRIDTTFSLFPNNLSGVLDVNDVKLVLSERNNFSMSAHLKVDTALLMGEGIPPYSIFETLPLEVDLPPQMEYGEVYSALLTGRITPRGDSIMASSLFTVNTLGMDELVTVADTSNLDVRADVSLPFSFNIDHVRYIDTFDLSLGELELPAMIERLTLELTFTSTLPLNLIGHFYAFDSEQQVVTDTLVGEGQLIAASFDGQPTHTTLSIDITEERLERVLGSDKIIMQYDLDTDAHDVVLNADQRLILYIKARAKYDASVEFDELDY